MKSQFPLFLVEQAPIETFSVWLEERRVIIARGGYAVRAGAGVRGHTIEVKSLTPHDQLAAEDPLRTNVWCVLALPEGAREFADARDRDAVLRRLEGFHTESREAPRFL